MTAQQSRNQEICEFRGLLIEVCNNFCGLLTKEHTGVA